MTDYQKPGNTGQTGELVDELESIKSLLDEDKLSSIPLLEEMIDDSAPINATQDALDNIPTLGELSPLPGQQGLFEEPPTTKTLEESHAKPSQNNPFLPKHIRERLGSSASYVQELEQQQRELEKQSLTMPFSLAVPSTLDLSADKNASKTPLQQTIANPDKLIDSLVEQYLPIIEDDLRQQLKQLIEKS